ncbi:MAG: copper resistance CopC family protein [Gammaproteobacteria bacterium]
MRTRLNRIILIFATLSAWPNASWAHAFPVASEPGAGGTVRRTPFDIRIQFNAELEPIFSHLRVDDSRGRTISEGEGHVDSSDATFLVTHVPAVPAGVYQVYWNVISHDGHRTQGDYTFSVH